MFKLCAILLASSLTASWWSLNWDSKPIRAEIGNIEAELETLPVTPINTSPWTLGYSTNQQEDPTAPAVVNITFPEPEVVDLVALLPATYTDDRNQLQSFGFPLRFTIERLLPDGGTQMLVDHRDADYPSPGIEPQLFTCSDTSLTSALRITITKRAPNPTWWQAEQVAALSEVFVFSGDKNVALNAAVEASSTFTFSYVWSPECLTDGFSLFSPIDHRLSNPMADFSALSEAVTLTMDLGETKEIDEFRMWPVVHSIQHNFPPSSGVGFPEVIQIEIAAQSDFSDSKFIYAESARLQRPGAGPYMRQIPPVTGRYIRLHFEAGMPDFRRLERTEITLSEIQFLNRGRVVSNHLPITSSYPEHTSDIVRLTDGKSSEGTILPLRQWVTTFKRRVDLEQHLAILNNQLEIAQTKDEQRVTTILVIAAGLILLLTQSIWLVRAAARKRWANMRERIACDLHDEIGANVSSIAHTAELLDETIQQPNPTQKRLLNNLIQSARLTSREAKNFIRFMESESKDRDLTEQLTLVADQILGTIKVSFSLKGIHRINNLDPSTKWNLLLFYKEALNNITKHSGAEKVDISTNWDGQNWILTICDNGRGMNQSDESCNHLRSRSQMRGGALKIHSQPGEGTTITLKFNKHRKP